MSASAQTCSPFPCVVTTVTLTNQSKAIPATTIYTPNTDGLFRVSAYLSLTTVKNVNNEGWELLLAWTDEIGTKKANTNSYNGGSNALTDTFVVRGIAGQPLGYTTNPISGGGPQSNYNLFIVVEELE
jgi:hypothetical protein